ncbi:MAG TPA: heme o synthase [Dehalococcoidia bacterium]|nr:heme o synthase [Dehalococcoidia bacterium]
MATTVSTRARVTRDISEVLAVYLRLTKPRIIMLLVVTTVPAMILAEGGMPSLWLILATVAGGSVVAGGANAMNMYFDRDIDELMLRTQERPVPAGQVEPQWAALFGLALGAGGFLFLQLAVNLLAASLTIFAFVFYVVVYTLILKRNTSQNIVIGGAAGAMPPVIGWAAVTNSVSVEALLMFAIVTFWTPPHFWALSLNYSSDYKRAGVPMLPVVAGPAETKRQILLHSFAMVASTLALGIVVSAGVIYFVAAAALGAAFLYFAIVLWREASSRPAMMLFRYSIAYLALLFGAIAVEGLI